MKSRTRNGLLLAMSALLLASARAEVRVALVATERSDRALAVLDLATVKLSAEPGLHVLERQAIESVLAEQEWSLAGIVGAADAVRAGRLLEADILMVLQQPVLEQPTVVVAFDSLTGIRLVDDEVPGESLEVQAARVAELCCQAVRKRGNPDHSTRTLSVLAVQNVDLPAHQEYLAGAIGYLLERQLIRSPSVTILERERLETLTAERALHAGSMENGLWTSVYLLEMDIGRGGQEDDIRIYARITDSAGKPQGEFVRTGPASAQDLVDSIQNELVRLLEMAPPPAAPAREVEAERYRREAEIQSQQKQVQLAIRAAEAAYALNPDEVTILRGMVRYHFTYAHSLPREDDARQLLTKTHWLELLWRKHGDVSEERELAFFLDFRCPSVDPERKRGSSPRPNQTEYIQLLRKLQHEYACYLGLEKPEYETDSPERRRVIEIIDPRYVVYRIAAASPDRDTYIRYLSDYMRWWMENVRRNPESYTSFDLSEIMRSYREMTVQSYDDHSWFALDSQYYDGLRPLFVEMSAHPVLYMSLYGRLGILFCDLKTGKITPVDALTQVKLIDEEVKTRISENVEGEESLRGLLYLFLLDMYDQIADLDERQLLYHGLFEFMLEQKTLVPAVGQAATVPYAGYRICGNIHETQSVSTSQYPRLMRNAERYLEVIRNRDQYVEYPTLGWIERELRTTAKALETMREALGLPMGDHPWAEAVLVMDLTMTAPELTRIDQIHVEGDSLYILASSLRSVEKRKIALFKSELNAQKLNCVFRLAFDKWLLNQQRLGTMCRYQKKTYIPTYGFGVLVVSDDGSHHWINKESGLPSDQVHSIAVMDQSLYIASGEEGEEVYLSQYDMDTAKWTLLAASQRREKIGPLDPLPPYVVRGIYADPERNRLVFTVDYGNLFLNWRVFRPSPVNVPEIGVWSYAPKSQSFKQLMQVNHSLTWHRLTGDYLFVAPWSPCPYSYQGCHPWFGMVVTDLKTDLNGIVYYSDKTPIGAGLEASAASLYAPEQLQEPPYAVQRDCIWFARPTFGRQLFSGEVQFYPDVFPDKEQAKRIEHLTLADDGATLIVATDTQVWMFKRDPSIAMRDEDWEQFISR